MCDRLRENFKRNNLKEPTIYNYAITGQVGLVTLSEVKDTTCKVISNNGNTPSTTIDALLGNMAGIAVLKMDIEWCEVEAIKQSELFFKNNSPLLAVELVDREIFNSFKSIIEKYGYRTDGRNYASTPTYIWERTI
jgi:FkbM family methyltransferase